MPSWCAINCPSNNKTFDFFGLPEELRCMIYSLCTRNVYISNTHLFTHMWLPRAEMLDSACMTPLLVCKLMKEEYEAEMSRQTETRLVVNYHSGIAKAYNPFKLGAVPALTIIPSSLDSSLRRTLQTVRNLSLRSVDANTEGWQTQRLLECMPQLRSIEFNVWAGHYEDELDDVSILKKAEAASTRMLGNKHPHCQVDLSVLFYYPMMDFPDPDLLDPGRTGQITKYTNLTLDWHSRNKILVRAYPMEEPDGNRGLQLEIQSPEQLPDSLYHDVELDVKMAFRYHDYGLLTVNDIRIAAEEGRMDNLVTEAGNELLRRKRLMDLAS